MLQFILNVPLMCLLWLCESCCFGGISYLTVLHFVCVSIHFQFLLYHMNRLLVLLDLSNFANGDLNQKSTHGFSWTCVITYGWTAGILNEDPQCSQFLLILSSDSNTVWLMYKSVRTTIVKIRRLFPSAVNSVWLNVCESSSKTSAQSRGGISNIRCDGD